MSIILLDNHQIFTNEKPNYFPFCESGSHLVYNPIFTLKWTPLAPSTVALWLFKHVIERIYHLQISLVKKKIWCMSQGIKSAGDGGELDHLLKWTFSWRLSNLYDMITTMSSSIVVHWLKGCMGGSSFDGTDDVLWCGSCLRRGYQSQLSEGHVCLEPTGQNSKPVL